MHRVVVAMSGGVDSSVAAARLLEQGFEVIGVTMRLWGGADADPFGERRFGGCCSINETEDARRVAEILGVPHFVFNLEKAFTRDVVDNFVEEYTAGRTPNPCVRCNRFIKFDVLFQKAKELAADFIATGHYAQVTRDERSGRYRLLKGVDRQKDQSYVLYPLNQSHLRFTLFPLGELRKEQTRQLADRYGFSNAFKPDSQEICFVEDNDYRKFLKEYRPEVEREGEIVDASGQVLGYHHGTAFFTIGQRKGLGISAPPRFPHQDTKIGTPRPLYVIGIDPARNRVVVGSEDNLLAYGVTAEDFNWVSGTATEPDLQVSAQIRYNSTAVAARVELATADRVVVKFDQPVKAVTPGQSLVLYDEDEVLGGGIITEPLREAGADKPFVEFGGGREE